MPTILAPLVALPLAFCPPLPENGYMPDPAYAEALWAAGPATAESTGGSPSLTAAVADVQLTLDRLLAAIPVITRNLDHSDAQHTRVVDAILERLGAA